MKRAQNSHSKTQIRLLEEIKAVHANSHLFGHPVFKCMVNQLQLGVCVIVAYLKQMSKGSRIGKHGRQC